jgi:hypothetical protein
MTPSLLPFDLRKKNISKRVVKIVLTASATEMSDFYNNQFFAFMGGFSKGPVPLWLPRKQLYPLVGSKYDGIAKYAPYFQSVITGLNLNITSVVANLMISALLSQLISNVPLVALYLPMLMNAGASTKELMALAAGSTVAGNLFILGAASNVIIIQNAEKKFGETITFLDFAKIGVILTAVNLLVYWLFLLVGA